ncbi:MAG: M50 family metallopeptidase [Acidobacteria bacterium]|nr:M50 family metallopeptidase [Acidobacteriota bacterium]
MRRLRAFLRICFGYLTLVSLVVSIFMVRTFLWMRQHPQPNPWDSAGGRHLSSISFLSLSYFVRFIPLLMALTYGTAWWTLKQGRRSARGWSIAASILMILSTAALLTARLTLFNSGRHHFRGTYLLFQVFFLAVGILGLIVFSRTSSESIQSARKTRHRGDGTSAFLDLFVSGLALTGVWGGIIFYTRWGHAQNLPFIRGAVAWPIILLVIFLTICLHEAAHACVGLALGMKLRTFVVGPFQWRIRDGRWTYRFVPAGFLSFGGSTGIVSAKPNQSRWVEIAMISAGPLSNLIAGLLAVFLTVSARDQQWELYWEPTAFFALVNIVTFTINLVPFRPEALYSDGARIFQLLSGGPWAELHRVYSFVLSSSVTPLRPRNYDIQAINSAAAYFTSGREALMLRIFATSYFLDRNQIDEARAQFTEVTSMAQDAALSFPSDLLPSFVFNAVFLKRDALAARRYWDQFEAKTPTHFGVDYWLARSALHFIENHPLEARDAWNVGAALARELPIAGAYEFDRDRYRLMRDLLNSASPSDSQHPSVSSAKLLRMPARDCTLQVGSRKTSPDGNVPA